MQHPIDPIQGGTGVNNNNASTLTISGNYPLTITLNGSTAVTFPTSGTLLTGATGVSSLTGTTDEITVSSSTGAVTLSISSGYAGQTSITTLGTITTGTWNGTAIGTSYLPASQSQLTTASNLVTVGTITSGTWNGTTIAVGNGGTGQTTAAAAMSALSPITTTGDLIYSSSATTNSRLPIGSTGNVLTVSGGVPIWAAPATSGTVTSVGITGDNGIGVSGSPITSSGSITLTLGAITPSTVNSITLSGSSSPSLTVTGTSSISGSNTGDQTITLTGDVAGSGTGSFATTLATVNSDVGSYTNANITVNAKGLITSVNSGPASGVSSVSSTDSALTISPTTGDVIVSANNFTSTTHGTVPASGGGTTNYLRADGTWDAPGGNVTSITGTTNQITASASTGAVILSLPSSVTISGTMQAGTFSGAGTDLTGTASSLSIGGNATTATNANNIEIGGGSGSGPFYPTMVDATTGYLAMDIDTGWLLDPDTGAMTVPGTITITDGTVTNLTSPVNSSDAATKAYVDAAVSNLNVHEAVVVATTGTLTATYTPGSLDTTGGHGIGATLTNSTTQTQLVIDGITLTDLGPINLVGGLGTITGGSSYTNGIYTNVPLTGGTGTGAQATVTITGNTVTSVIISVQGTGYAVGDTLSASNSNLGGTGSGFSVPIAIVLSDRVLVKNQSTQTQNGIYLVTTQGSGSSNWVLTRATDYNNSILGQVRAGTFAFVAQGTTNANTGWVETAVGTYTDDDTIIGTDDITYTQFSGAGTYLAGTGLSLAGGTFSNTGVLSVTTNTGLSTNVTATGNVTITNTGVTSAVAGTGIGVSASTGAVTITNAGVTSLTGTANEITVSSSTGAVTLSISSGYAGQTSITTLGTITTGTWQATAIANTYLANDSVQVTAGTGLSGGGTATLGGSAITLTNSGVTSITGTTNQITASASTGAVTLSLASNLVLAAPSSGETLQVHGAASEFTASIVGSSTTSGSYGLAIQAGTNSTDRPIYIVNYADTANLFTIYGDGHFVLGNNGSTQTISSTSAGNVTIGAPTSGTALNVYGAADTNALTITSGNSASTQSAELYISRAGSTANIVAGGPSIEFTDSVNDTVTNIQQSGGQTEFWQYNGSWSQCGFFSTTLVLNLNAGLNIVSGPIELYGSAGAAGQVLTSGGSGTLPTWSDAASSGVTSITGTTNQITASASTGAVTLSLVSPLTLPGSLILANDTNIQFVDTGGTARETLTMTTSNLVELVNESAAGSIAIVVDNTSGNIGFFTNSATEYGSLNNTGNWSFGPPSSGQTLRVNAADGNYAEYIVGSSTTSGSYGLGIQAGTTSTDLAIKIVNYANTADLFTMYGDGHFVLGNNGSTQTISTTAAGNVTIGAPASGATLNVNGAADNYAEYIAGSSTTSGSYGLLIQAGTTSTDAPIQILNYANTANLFTLYGDGHFVLGSNGSTQTISTTSAGNVTIGAPTSGIGISVSSGINLASGALELDGSAGTSGQVLTSGGSGTLPTWTTLSGGTGITYDAGTITNTGVTSAVAGTGIGVSSSTGAVTITNDGVTSITGTANEITASSSTGAVILSLPSSVTISGTMTAGTFDATSDQNLKTNISPIINSGEIIDSIDGVNFNWKKDGKASVGVIAQQVQTVLPAAVHSCINNDEIDEHLTVNYNALVAVLIEQVKDLRARVAQLEDM